MSKTRKSNRSEYFFFHNPRNYSTKKIIKTFSEYLTNDNINIDTDGLFHILLYSKVRLLSDKNLHHLDNHVSDK